MQLLDAVVYDTESLVERESLDVFPVHHRQRKRRAVPMRSVRHLAISKALKAGTCVKGMLSMSAAVQANQRVSLLRE